MQSDKMKLSVFGLGYVGCISAACFASEAHDVVGVDINQTKVDIINAGRSPIVEPGISELIERVVESKHLRATTDSVAAVLQSDLSLVCVGTPSKSNGSLSLGHVEKVCEEIGLAIGQKGTNHVVVMRSTILPGTIEGLVIPVLEKSSGKRAGVDFSVCSNPEFLREGSSLNDFYSPPFTLIGADDQSAARMVGDLYATIDAPVYETSLKTAEMIKYVCNSFHGLKVAFANEIGSICKQLGIDSHEVMSIFCEDKKLNLSRYYLQPGFAFGGSCLPKDLRAINYKARELDVDVPVLASILPSNRLQIERAVDLIVRIGKKRIGVLGFSFKPNTDDLRESPVVTLIETLIGKGFQLSLYDRDVSVARLFGANKEYIDREIPHISQLMRDNISQIVESAELIVIGKKSEEFQEIQTLLRPGQAVLDLVRLFAPGSESASYQGICW